MYLSGLECHITGVIFKTEAPTMVNDKLVTNVTLAVAEGYNEKKHYVYVQCAFWAADAKSITVYPVNHNIYATGMLTAEPYTDNNGKLAVTYKLNVTGWKSLQRLEKQSDKAEKSDVTNTATINNAGQTVTDEPVNNANSSAAKMDEIKQILDYRFKSGGYKGKTIGEVLKADPAFIHKVASGNGNLKRICTIAYNFYYETMEKRKSSGRIEGVKHNYIPQYSPDTPDECLPF